MSGTKQKGEPHYSQGPTPSKPCPNATMDFAPPREDLTSGSVNLITNEVSCFIIHAFRLYFNYSSHRPPPSTVLLTDLHAGWKAACNLAKYSEGTQRPSETTPYSTFNNHPRCCCSSSTFGTSSFTIYHPQSTTFIERLSSC